LLASRCLVVSDYTVTDFILGAVRAGALATVDFVVAVWAGIVLFFCRPNNLPE
jgi:hypothetical protein